MSNFAAGQIDTAAQRDSSKALYQAACQKARNMRILTGGAMKRRPGTWIRAALAGQAVGIEFVADSGSVYKVIFSNGRLDIYDSNNSAVLSAQPGPWTTGILDALYLDRSLGRLVIAHQSFVTRVLSVDASGTWTIGNFAFDDAFSGGPAQPYWRYASTKGITLAPSALTGAGVTLTASAALFVTGGSGHTGARFRYLGRSMLVTAVSSGTSATVTVDESLPPTVTFTVDVPDGFSIGEEAEELDSAAKGIITNISGSTITFVYLTNFNAIKNGGTLVGGSSSSQATITGNPSNTTPAAVTDWDEQAFSTVRGYPGGAATHRGRLYFFNMRDLPRGVCASAAGLPNYFLVGDRDGDAFFEEVPDYRGQRLLHVVTADQGLVLTDKASYYLPETPTQPVTPSTIDFKFIAPIGASTIRPIPTEQGFAFIENGANRAIGILPTGSVQQPWESSDLSAFWSELLTGPVRLGTSESFTGFPERYGFVINADGTVACIKYQNPQAPVPVGWTWWDTALGTIADIFPAGGKLFAIVNRSTPSAWTLEEFVSGGTANEIMSDASVFFTDPTAALNYYVSDTVVVTSNSYWYRGTYSVDGSGKLVGCSLGTGQYLAGRDIVTELKPVSPVVDHPAYRHGARIGLPRIWLHVKDTGAYTVSGQDNPAYRSGENSSVLVALRTEAKRWKVPGRAYDLAPDITQATPAPLQVEAIQMEVSF